MVIPIAVLHHAPWNALLRQHHENGPVVVGGGPISGQNDRQAKVRAHPAD